MEGFITLTACCDLTVRNFHIGVRPVTDHPGDFYSVLKFFTGFVFAALTA